jgi:hypothetical protein
MSKRLKGTAYHYRDTRSGRFVPKSTWKRSKAQGGTRYKREKQKRKKEYMVNVIHEDGGKGSPEVELQISVMSDNPTTKKKVLQAVESRMKNGKDEKGFETEIKFWKKGTKKFEGETASDDNAWTRLSHFMRLSKSKVL